MRSQRLVGLIGVFKLAKAAALIAVGVMGLVQSPHKLVVEAERAVSWLGLAAGRRTLTHSLERLDDMDRATLMRLSLLALAYAAVFIVEGVGLLLRQTWAEWLTVVVTASFIPLEIYELAKHPGPGKVVALLLNLAILVYLVWRRLQERRGLRKLLPA